MSTVPMICAMILCLALAAGAFVISYRQFREKGYLFNNVYFWASQEERKQMDENKESKRFHYRQSGIIFMLMGFFFLADVVYILTRWTWACFMFWAFIIITVVYAVVSSVQIIRRHK